MYHITSLYYIAKPSNRIGYIIFNRLWLYNSD